MPSPYAVSSSRAVPAPVDETFAHTLPYPLTDLFSRRYLALPRITRVDQDGTWGSLGQERTIHLADGGSMREILTMHDEPHAFGYELSEIRGPLAPLADRVDGTWAFEQAGTGTRVTWSWVIHPKRGVGAAAMPVFARMWAGYARLALEELERSLV